MDSCEEFLNTVFRTSSSVTTLTNASSWGFLATRLTVPFRKPSEPGKYMSASPERVELRELKVGSSGRCISPSEHTGAKDNAWARVHRAVLVNFMLNETTTGRASTGSVLGRSSNGGRHEQRPSRPRTVESGCPRIYGNATDHHGVGSHQLLKSPLSSSWGKLTCSVALELRGVFSLQISWCRRRHHHACLGMLHAVGIVLAFIARQWEHSHHAAPLPCRCA